MDKERLVREFGREFCQEFSFQFVSSFLRKNNQHLTVPNSTNKNSVIVVRPEESPKKTQSLSTTNSNENLLHNSTADDGSDQVSEIEELINESSEEVVQVEESFKQTQLQSTNDEDLLDDSGADNDTEQVSEILEKEQTRENVILTETNENGPTEGENSQINKLSSDEIAPSSFNNNMNKNLNTRNSIESETTIIDQTYVETNVETSNKNDEVDMSDEEILIEPEETHDIAARSDTMEEELNALEQPSRKKLKMDSIPDSLDIGKSKYFKKKQLPVYDKLTKDSSLQERASVDELRFIRALGTRPSKISRPEGNPKKIQLRSTNVEKPLDISNISDLVNNETISDSDSDASASSFPSRSKQNKLLANKAKNAYSMEEDYKILKFIIDNCRYDEIKGNQLWKDMEEKNLIASRSWQSMKERYRKTISTSIWLYVEMFKMDKKVAALLQENSLGSSAEPSKNMPKNEAKLNILSSSYSLEEDQAIIKFISHQLDSNESPMGRAVWEKASQHFHRQLRRERTWQSLKERFIKRIVPRLDTYDNIKTILTYKKAIMIVDKCATTLSVRHEMKKKLKKRYNIA